MDSIHRFQELLRELFQFDLADLDFGLYRLLRLKRVEIEAFITEQLPRNVDEAFAGAADEESIRLQTELEDLSGQIRENVAEDAIFPNGEIKEEYQKSRVKIVKDLIEKYSEVREKFEGAQAVESNKAEIFNHLYNFFSRYYEDGDFIPKRRYGSRETYAVPYDLCQDN